MVITESRVVRPDKLANMHEGKEGDTHDGEEESDVVVIDRGELQGDSHDFIMGYSSFAQGGGSAELSAPSKSAGDNIGAAGVTDRRIECFKLVADP